MINKLIKIVLGLVCIIALVFTPLIQEGSVTQINPHKAEFTMSVVMKGLGHLPFAQVAGSLKKLGANSVQTAFGKLRKAGIDIEKGMKYVTDDVDTLFYKQKWQFLDENGIVQDLTKAANPSKWSKVVEKARKIYSDLNNKINPNTSVGSKITQNDHTWLKHSGDFPDMDQNKLTNYIDDVIKNPDDLKIIHGERMAFWDEGRKAIIIINSQNPNGWTAFVPKDKVTRLDIGKSYFINNFY